MMQKMKSALQYLAVNLLPCSVQKRRKGWCKGQRAKAFDSMPSKLNVAFPSAFDMDTEHVLLQAQETRQTDANAALQVRMRVSLWMWANSTAISWRKSHLCLYAAS